MSTPYRLEQNKLVKHANQAIVEMEKNMLHAHNLNKSFWAKIVANEVYTQNWCPTKVLDFIMPEETWSGMEALHCIHACVWMCCLRNVPDEKMGKLTAKDNKYLYKIVY